MAAGREDSGLVTPLAAMGMQAWSMCHAAPGLALPSSYSEGFASWSIVPAGCASCPVHTAFEVCVVLGPALTATDGIVVGG